ncbi:MAG: amidohydrolase family protein [Oscillospiraceae bacterium]
MCRRKKNIHFPVRNAILTWHAGSWEQRKLLWGTDIPWLLGTANYQQLVAHGKFLLSDCTEKEREMMFAGNAWDVYWNHRK